MESRFAKLPADVLEAAKGTYELEKALAGELSSDALEKALEAGIRAYETRVTERIADTADMYADEFLEGEDTALEGATLRWFAEKLRGDLSPAGMYKKYEPQDDDVIEVTVTGVVTVRADNCEHCGHDTVTTWVVRDDNTGEDYTFEHVDIENGLRIRLLHKGNDPLS